MSTSSTRKRRVAGTAAILGVIGLALSAAAALNLTWQGTYQAGGVEVEATCQAGEVTAQFGDVDFDSAATGEHPWTVDGLNYTGIDTDCDGKSYEAAVRVGDTWSNVDTGTIDGDSISVEVSDVDDITDVALTIFE